MELRLKEPRNENVASGLLKEWGGTHPESGVTSSVSRVRPKLESWTLVDITIRNDSENASGSKVLKSITPEPPTMLRARGHLGDRMSISAESLPPENPRSLAKEVSSTAQLNPTLHEGIRQMSWDMSDWGTDHRESSLISRW